MTPCNKPQTKLLRSNTIQGPRHNFKAAAVVAKIHLTTEIEEKDNKAVAESEYKNLTLDRNESSTGLRTKAISSVPSNNIFGVETNSQPQKKNLPGFDIMQKSLKKFKM